MNPYDILHKKGHQGAFTREFKHRKPSLRHLKNLHEYAEYIREHPDQFNSITEKRANYYKNLIERGSSLPVKELKDFIKNSYNHHTDQIDDFQLDVDLSSNEVQVYINKEEKRLVIVFTGTYSTIDWVNNAVLVSGRYIHTRRFKHAKRVFEDALKKYPYYKVSLVSHSQSGWITHLLDSPRVQEVLTYNPAWLPLARQKKNEYITKTVGDPVSVAVFPDPKNTIFPTGSYNPLYNHSPDALDHLPQDKQIGASLRHFKSFYY